MNSIRSEWPLLVFTTGAPLCAGAWVVACVLVLLDAPQAGVLTMDACGVALCLLLAASLACSTLHLGKPVKALRAFRRLGNSTVSNEVFMGTLFAAFSILYLVVAHSLVDEVELWKILLVLVAAFAVLFVVFQCLAYRMRTITTWNSFAFSVEFALVALLGGLCLEGAASCAVLSLPYGIRSGLVVAEALCCVAMVLTIGAQGVVVSHGLDGKADALVRMKRWGAFGFARVVMLVIGSAVWGCGMLSAEPSVGLTVFGGAVVLGGIVVGRYAFYRCYCNVGLPCA